MPAIVSHLMRPSEIVFFVSGLAALAHESVWARLLVRVLGSDAAAAGTVLATYMAGLGLGAALWSGRAARARDPRRQFAALEVFIGLWAAGSPFILAELEPVDGALGRTLCAGLALLPPTLCMGATFPVMGRLAIASSAEAGTRSASFYGANTLGACAGALVAPFLLMPSLGLSLALVASGATSVAAGIGALLLRAAPTRVGRPGDPRESGGGDTGPRSADRTSRGLDASTARLLFATAACGASALALEVLLTRLLITVTGASVYAFAIVLAVFLGGIGLGSRQAVRELEKPGRAEPVLFLAALAVAPVTLAGLLALRLQLGEADLFQPLANRMPSGASTVGLWASHALFAGLALLPAACAFGFALPAAAGATCERHRDDAPERWLGRTYAANTGGALVGSLAAAFWLLPELGLRVGLALALGLALVGALAVGVRRRGWTLGGVALSAALGALLFRADEPAGVRIVASATGPHATATVEERDDAPDVRSLRVNGKVVATTAPVDLRLQRLLGLVPGLLHGDVRRALVIGLGTGMTAGGLLRLEELERLDVFEISRAVRAVAPAFADWNGALCEDARARIAIVDGRHALARSDERWDLITADPIHPWTRGSSDLYALEHFREIAAHLAPGGVASQWLPLYQLSRADVQTIVATWLAAFPEASAWLTAYDLALIGSHEPLGDLAGPLPGGVAGALAAAGIHSTLEVAVLRVADRERLAAFAAGVEPMRDDRPVLEFRAPRSYLAGYSVEALLWAADEATVDALPAAARERGRTVRRLVRDFVDALPRGLGAAARDYGAALIALEPLTERR